MRNHPPAVLYPCSCQEYMPSNVQTVEVKPLWWTVTPPPTRQMDSPVEKQEIQTPNPAHPTPPPWKKKKPCLSLRQYHMSPCPQCDYPSLFLVCQSGTMWARQGGLAWRGGGSRGAGLSACINHWIRKVSSPQRFHEQISRGLTPCRQKVE